MTVHSVVAVGRPLLARGVATLDLWSTDQVVGRLRVEGTDEVLAFATSDVTTVPVAKLGDIARGILRARSRRP
jgi:hypothetical protein